MQIEVNYKNKIKEITKIYDPNQLNEVQFCSLYYPNIQRLYPYLNLISYIVKKHNKNSFLTILYIKNKCAIQTKFKMVFSHGSSSDLGTSLSLLYNLSYLFKCDVVAYDYSGYGCSTGIASEKELRTDLNSVLRFLKLKLNISFSSLILFGYSIGTIPTVIEGGNAVYGSKLIGIILLSPLVKELSKYFKAESETNKKLPTGTEEESNFELIKEIVKPVFLVHGEKDLLVPINEVEEMCTNIRNLLKWFPHKGDHTNISSTYRAKFYRKAKEFIEDAVQKQIEEKKQKRNSSTAPRSCQSTKTILSSSLSLSSSGSGNSIVRRELKNLTRISDPNAQNSERTTTDIHTLDDGEDEK